MNFFKPEYRVVYDRFAGYEVQVRRWWFPFWVQLGLVNTFSTLEAAELYARAGGVAKYIGRLP